MQLFPLHVTHHRTQLSVPLSGGKKVPAKCNSVVNPRQAVEDSCHDFHFSIAQDVFILSTAHFSVQNCRKNFFRMKSAEKTFVQHMLSKPLFVLTSPVTAVSMLYHRHESWPRNAHSEAGRAAEYMHITSEQSLFIFSHHDGRRAFVFTKNAAMSHTKRRPSYTRGTAGLWYLFGKQTPGLPLGVLRHRENNSPSLPGDLGLLHAERETNMRR